jgi:hypothetical protein
VVQLGLSRNPPLAPQRLEVNRASAASHPLGSRRLSVLGHQSLKVLGGQHFDPLELVSDRHHQSPEILAPAELADLPSDVQPTHLIELEVTDQCARLLRVAPGADGHTVGVDRSQLPALRALGHPAQHDRK